MKISHLIMLSFLLEFKPKIFWFSIHFTNTFVHQCINKTKYKATYFFLFLQKKKKKRRSKQTNRSISLDVEGDQNIPNKYLWEEVTDLKFSLIGFEKWKCNTWNLNVKPQGILVFKKFKISLNVYKRWFLFTLYIVK